MAPKKEVTIIIDWTDDGTPVYTIPQPEDAAAALVRQADAAHKRTAGRRAGAKTVNKAKADKKEQTGESPLHREIRKRAARHDPADRNRVSNIVRSFENEGKTISRDTIYRVLKKPAP